MQLKSTKSNTSLYSQLCRICFLFAMAFSLDYCDLIRRNLITLFSPAYTIEDKSSNIKPSYIGVDADRPKIQIALNLVGTNFIQPTDLQFFPNADAKAIITEKQGNLIRYDMNSKEKFVIKSFKVSTASELGLLGMTFHPNFNSNKKIYLHYTIEKNKNNFSNITEWLCNNKECDSIKNSKLILEVRQPYANHNAGQIAFGPDGFLYIALGDGGWRADPQENGQNKNTLLGSMLRIDVNKSTNQKPYTIPQDNPFVHDKSSRGEIYAYGLRNPWRFSFDNSRLILADVGQGDWEEISIIEKGKNYGWNIMEGRHCFSPSKNCNQKHLTLPIYEYSHTEGQSITGGYVYRFNEKSKLFAKYIFGDFITGRIWALSISQNQNAEPFALGKWPMNISTFGRNKLGQVFVVDFTEGRIFLIQTLD